MAVFKKLHLEHRVPRLSCGLDYSFRNKKTGEEIQYQD